MAGPTVPPHVVIVAAFHQPDHDLARLLISSLLAQTAVQVNIVAVLDGEVTAADVKLKALLGDPRIATYPSEVVQGVRGAFAAGLARGLALFPAESTYFAYADQDDVWLPGKLARSIRLLRDTGATLAQCDARVVDEAGRQVAASLHAFEARKNPGNLLEALLLNSVSGMTAVFTAPAARLASRLMGDIRCSLLHDHVTAAAAASLGAIVRLDAALVDYVQHTDNVLGAKPVRNRPWYMRAYTARHLTAYRLTSRRIFDERREVACALHAAGQLPEALADMFLAGPRIPSVFHLLRRYAGAIPRLFVTGQTRRGFLCFRVLDGAWQCRAEI